MAISTLGLPIDIPWRRLAVSEDMYAPSEDGPLPIKWHTSLAVFFFEPEPDPALSNPDEVTTFLKVVATVTGFQPQGEEIDTAALTGSAFHDIIVQNYNLLTQNYFPCNSALLQVAVFPASGDFPLSQFPYLTDFEPKKREVVELVTDTGEALTQSANNLNVRKGTTTTDSIENVNIDRGGSFGLTVDTPKGGGGVSTSTQQEVGTRATLGQQGVNLTTTDASREKRESFSHTTSLAQLYQLLDSYHSGTNRAIFFVNARPHIVDSPFTFVNGPRQLEGVQEFFLVVRRPKEMHDFCVKAVLETAHLHESDTTVTAGSTVFDQQQLTQTFSAHADDGVFSGKTVTKTFTVPIPAGFKLDRSRGGQPFTVNWANGGVNTGISPAGVEWSLSGRTASDRHQDAIPNFTTFDDHVDFTASVVSTATDATDMSWTLTVFIISVDPISTPTTSTQHNVDLFITAREVRGCTHFPEVQPPTSPPGAAAFLAVPTGVVNSAPYVAYEKSLGDEVKAQLAAAKLPGRDAAVAANKVARAVKQEVVSSFRPGRRYVAGAIDFVHAAFAVRDLLNGVTAPSSEGGVVGVRATGATGLPPSVSPALRAKVEAAAPGLTPLQVWKTPEEELALHAGLSLREARELKLNMAGVALRRGAAPARAPAPPSEQKTVEGSGGSQATPAPSGKRKR